MKKIYKSIFTSSLLALLLLLNFTTCETTATGDYEQQALDKIEKLESLMDQAKSKSIDITREKTVLWFSKEFLKFADWDEANKPAIEKLFGYYVHYADNKAQMAEDLPDFERQKVIEILDKGINDLQKVLDGKIKRRPGVVADWENIEVKNGMLYSNGKPVFLHDYFSKTVGASLTDTLIYNDHLGAIHHGGQRLYEVDEDRPSNPFLVKEDGTFDQKRLSYFDDIPDTNVGFLILWNSGMPQWIHHREPEVAKGRSLFTGFDVDNPLMREVWSKAIRKTGEVTKGKKVTQLGYILSNEPHWFSEKGHWTQNFKEMNSISSYTLQKFRDWLSVKYDNNIEELNTNWESSFADFNAVEIEIPIDKATRGTPIWYDWCRYNMDRGIDWFTFLQNELHKANPDADTHVKIMSKTFTDDYRSHGIDLEALTELTTMIGDDAKAFGGRALTKDKPEKWEAKYAYYWDQLTVFYDFLESVGPDKVHINSETHFISASHWRDLNTSPDYIRSCFWLATLHGMDAGISWFWARDADGSPEDRLEGELDFFDPALAGSYAGSANMQPQTVNEVAQVMMDMNAFSEEIMALRNQRRPLRIFYTETSAINKKQHLTELHDLYESLYFEGFPLGYATEKIINKHDHNNWDVVVVFKTPYVTDTEFDALQNYLDQGGTIILDGEGSLTMNEYGQLRKKSLSQGSGKLVVLDQGASIDALKIQALEVVSGNREDIVLTESNGSAHKGCTWRVVKNSDGGYWMNILNLGKNNAQLKVSNSQGGKVVCTNMLTGQEMGDEFELKPLGVLLLEIKTK